MGYVVNLLIAGVLLMVQQAPAVASPMMTVLRKAAPVDAAEPQSIVRGFSQCDPVAALDRESFLPVGARYMGHSEKGIDFSGNGLKDRAFMVLQGGVLTAAPDGKVLVWRVNQPLRRPLRLAAGVEVVAIGQQVSFESGPRPEVAITYRFNRPLLKVLPILEQMAGKALRTALDYAKWDPKAVGFEFDSMEGLPGAYSLTCLRRPE